MFAYENGHVVALSAHFQKETLKTQISFRPSFSNIKELRMAILFFVSEISPKQFLLITENIEEKARLFEICLSGLPRLQKQNSHTRQTEHFKLKLEIEMADEYFTT